MALGYASVKGEIDMGARVDVREQGFTPLLAVAQFGQTELGVSAAPGQRQRSGRDVELLFCLVHNHNVWFKIRDAQI